MEICKHNIMKREIVGIGPMFSKVNGDQIARTLYKEKMLFFELHLRCHTITIQSEWISFADHLTDEQKDKSVQRQDEFMDAYSDAKEIILGIINEG